VGISRDQAQGEIAAQLEARRSEIEGAALTRVHAIADPLEASDPEYSDGLKLAVSAAVDFGLAAVEQGDEHAPPIPTVLLGQARLAARNGVPLEIVLRRYFTGYTLFCDFLVQETEVSLDGSRLQRLLRAQGALFDRLVTAVTEEYGRESGNRLHSSEQRRVERVQRLLDGELLDVAGFAYDFEAWHLGVLASGPNAVETIRDLSKALNCRLLFVPEGKGAVWAWLGGRNPIVVKDALSFAEGASSEVTMAFGEPASGLAGWRFTHRQALAALSVAHRCSERLIRYADVALVASFLKDDLLATSLRNLYLVPLSGERDGGETLRETLRAFLSAQRNVSSTAAALGVRRHTVANRLRTIEKRLGRSLDTCTAEIDAALRLEDLGSPVLPRR
jgi:PucR-like helix-turn-helix protein/diguanylate cyclase with GGDEF domain